MGNPPQGPYGLPATGQPAPMQPGDFTSAVMNHQLRVADCEVDPPVNLYVDVDDVFFVTAWSLQGPWNAHLTIRLLTMHGKIETITFPNITVGVGSIIQKRQVGREGYLLSCSLNTETGATVKMPNYCTVALQRMGADQAAVARTLIAGQVRPLSGLGWPDTPVRQPMDVQPTPFTFTVGSPAAGADWTTTINANTRVMLVGVNAQLVTAVAAATRTASLKITDGANLLYLVDATSTQIASLTYIYSGYPNGFSGGIAGTHQYWPLPAPFLLGPGYTVSSVTANIQGADQWSLISLATLVWCDTI